MGIPGGLLILYIFRNHTLCYAGDDFTMYIFQVLVLTQSPVIKQVVRKKFPFTVTKILDLEISFDKYNSTI